MNPYRLVVLIDEELKSNLDQLAEKARLPRSLYVRQLLAQHIDQHAGTTKTRSRVQPASDDEIKVFHDFSPTVERQWRVECGSKRKRYKPTEDDYTWVDAGTSTITDREAFMARRQQLKDIFRAEFNIPRP